MVFTAMSLVLFYILDLEDPSTAALTASDWSLAGLLTVTLTRLAPALNFISRRKLPPLDRRTPK